MMIMLLTSPLSLQELVSDKQLKNLVQFKLALAQLEALREAKIFSASNSRSLAAQLSLAERQLAV